MSSSSSSNKYNTPISGNTENGTEGQLTIDIRPLLEDVSQVMTKHISHILSGVVGEYTVYKETHNTIMGLPCVRKLQERITDLENQLNGGGGPVVQATASASSAASSSTSPSEISELQTAIVELNRYIQVLESRVDVKNIHQSHQPEEAIRLEVQENDLEDDDADEDEGEPADEPVVDIPPSFHTNHIVDSSIDYNESVDTDAEAVAEEEEAEEEEAEEDTESAAEEEEAEAEEAEDTEAAAEEDTEAAADEEEADEDTEAAAEEAAAEAEEAEEAEDTEADETEAAAEVSEAEEADETEAAAEVSEAEEAEAPEEEIEVSEIKIKGVTYFTTNAQNGIIYACVDDDVGDEVGVFKNGVALFNKNNKAAATKK
jgi:hypothetical protein